MSKYITLKKIDKITSTSLEFEMLKSCRNVEDLKRVKTSSSYRGFKMLEPCRNVLYLKKAKNLSNCGGLKMLKTYGMS